MSSYYALLLPRLIGTTVTTYDDVPPDVAPTDSPARRIPGSPSRASNSPSVARSPSPAHTTRTADTEVSAMTEVSWTWVITERLSEEVACMTEDDVKMGTGPSQAVGKFLCHLEGHPDREAFMRIYYQIPTAGTEDARLDTLAQQAVPPPVRGELESFKLLKGCPGVPRFLGHAEKAQGDRDLVPGGYIQYVVWEKVPGKPLTKEFFWSLDRSARDEIREKFRATYEQILSRGTEPGFSSISKIIYDQSTGMLRISGFRQVWPIPDELEWTDGNYVAYGLAKMHGGEEWWLHPEMWEW